MTNIAYLGVKEIAGVSVPVYQVEGCAVAIVSDDKGARYAVPAYAPYINTASLPTTFCIGGETDITEALRKVFCLT